MKTEYIFFTTDESFDYPTGYGYATYHEKASHGFEISIDTDNKIDFSSFSSFGSYAEMEDKCKNLTDLKNYIIEHLDEIEEPEEKFTYTNREIFEELLEIIDENIAA